MELILVGYNDTTKLEATQYDIPFVTSFPSFGIAWAL